MFGMDPNERIRPARQAPAPPSALRNANGSHVTSMRQLVALIAPMTVEEWLTSKSAVNPHPLLAADLAANGVLPASRGTS